MTKLTILAFTLVGALSTAPAAVNAQKRVKSKVASRTTKIKTDKAKTTKPSTKSTAQVTLRVSKKQTPPVEGPALKLTATKSGATKASHLNSSGRYVSGFSQGPGGSMGFGAIGGTVALGNRGGARSQNSNAQAKKAAQGKEAEHNALLESFASDQAKAAGARVQSNYNANLRGFQRTWAAQRTSINKILKPLHHDQPHGPRPQLQKMERAKAAANEAIRKGTATKFQHELVRDWSGYQAALAKILAGTNDVHTKAKVISVHENLQKHIAETAKPLPKGWGARTSQFPSEFYFGATKAQTAELTTQPHEFTKLATKLVRDIKYKSKYQKSELVTKSPDTFRKYQNVAGKIDVALRNMSENLATRSDIRVLKKWLPKLEVMNAKASAYRFEALRAMRIDN